MDMAHVDQSIVGSFSRVRRWWGWGLLFVALTLALPIFAVPASQAHAALVAQPIINRNSGKCLDVVNASTADQANVQQFICRGTANQRWYVIPNIIPTTNAPDGTYRIVNMNSGKCLDWSTPVSPTRPTSSNSPVMEPPTSAGLSARSLATPTRLTSLSMSTVENVWMWSTPAPPTRPMFSNSPATAGGTSSGSGKRGNTRAILTRKNRHKIEYFIHAPVLLWTYASTRAARSRGAA